MRAFASLLGSLILSAGLYGQNPDIDALQAVNVHRNQQLDPTFGFITQSAAPVSIAIPVLTTGIGFLAKDTSVFYKGLFIGETMAVSALITYGMKYGIDRERPYDTYPFIEGLFHEKTPSFPSGHTSVAFASATALTLAFPKWYVALPSFAWAGSVGYSRLHNGVHYPSDVMVGALVGSGSAFLSWKLNQWLFHHAERPSAY